MYDVYRHVDRKTLLLTVPQGAGLPDRASASKWRLFAKRKAVPKIVLAEVDRIGYCVTQPRKSGQV